MRANETNRIHNKENTLANKNIHNIIIIIIYSLDRLLLAILWTIYMKVSWNTDEQDVAYHKEQLQRKKFELSQ